MRVTDQPVWNFIAFTTAAGFILVAAFADPDAPRARLIGALSIAASYVDISQRT
jgi:hypothetical protein